MAELPPGYGQRESGLIWPENVPKPTDPAMVRGLLALSRGLADDVRTLKAGSGLPALLASMVTAGSAAGKFPYYTGENAVAIADLTAQARTLLALSDYADWRSTLGLAIGTHVLAYREQATQAQMEAGTETAILDMSPLGVAQAIAALGFADVGIVKTRGSATASGAAEHLQATLDGETLSNTADIEFVGESIVPEIDRDTLNITFILDDDTELAGTAYDLEGWYEIFGSTFTSASATGGANISFGNVGNGTGESFNFLIRMLSTNGTQPDKFFACWVGYHFDNGSLNGIRLYYFMEKVTTTKRIKGARVDTDNAGDMLNSGKLYARSTRIA